MSMSVMSRLQRVRFGLTSLLVISSIGATFLTQLYADRNTTEKNPPYSKRTSYSNINYMPHRAQDFFDNVKFIYLLYQIVIDIRHFSTYNKVKYN